MDIMQVEAFAQLLAVAPLLHMLRGGLDLKEAKHHLEEENLLVRLQHSLTTAGWILHSVPALQSQKASTWPVPVSSLLLDEVAR